MGSGNHPTRLPKGAQNVFALEVLESGSEGFGSIGGREPQLCYGSVENRSLCKDDRSFNEVLQFPDVSWPVPPLQFADDLGGNGLDVLVHAPREFLTKIAHQQGYVP